MRQNDYTDSLIKKDKVISQEAARKLLEALKAAQDHLEFCGYGDSYEREGAEAQGLPDKIQEAIAAAERGES